MDVYVVEDGTSIFAIPSEDFNAEEHTLIKKFTSDEFDKAFIYANKLNIEMQD